MNINSGLMPRTGTLHGGLWIKKKESVYSPDQVLEWLKRIGYIHQFSRDDIIAGKFPTSLQNLHIILRLQLVAFMYENTEMHYTESGAVTVKPDEVYHRLIVQRKGSYCFGLNGLMLEMLRGLGYRAYAGAARINKSTKSFETPVFSAFQHMVIFVQPSENDNTTYLVDTGTIGLGPYRPMLLSDAIDNVVVGSSPAQKHRLTKRAHPQSSLYLAAQSPFDGNHDCGDGQWSLEVLHEKSDALEAQSQWNIFYAFNETEYFWTDFESANISVYCFPRGLFWENVLCRKNFWVGSAHIDGEEVDILEGHIGSIFLMGSTVTRYIGSEKEIIMTVSTENERIGVLKEVFGIEISDEERQWIAGRVSALTP